MKSQWILAVAGLALLAGCQQKATAPASSGPPVATVDGQPIDRDLYEFYVKNVAGKPSNEISADQRDQALDNLLRAKVIAEQAQKDGTATDKDTAAMVELTRLNVLQNAVSEKYLKDKKPTEQELRAEYETQISGMSKQEYHARHILVATEPFATKLINELDKGAKFEDLAKRESMDTSKDSGGDLGWFTPDRMVKPFAEAVMALKPGEFTHTPVQTQFGWHVIKLEETRDVAPPPFDSVKQRLENMVQAKKFKSYVDGLMKTAKVEKKLEPAAAAPAAGSAPAASSAPAEPAKK
jgi:peptidyl-prolyl cis-trans isomerase C